MRIKIKHHTQSLTPLLVSKLSFKLDCGSFISPALPLYGSSVCSMVWQDELHVLPPSIDSHIGWTCKPGVENVNTAQSVRSYYTFPEWGVIVQPQALPEPVHRVNPHYSTLPVHQTSFLEYRDFEEVEQVYFAGQEQAGLRMWQQTGVQPASRDRCEFNLARLKRFPCCRCWWISGELSGTTS